MLQGLTQLWLYCGGRDNYGHVDTDKKSAAIYCVLTVLCPCGQVRITSKVTNTPPQHTVSHDNHLIEQTFTDLLILEKLCLIYAVDQSDIPMYQGQEQRDYNVAQNQRSSDNYIVWCLVMKSSVFFVLIYSAKQNLTKGSFQKVSAKKYGIFHMQGGRGVWQGHFPYVFCNSPKCI